MTVCDSKDAARPSWLFGLMDDDNNCCCDFNGGSGEADLIIDVGIVLLAKFGS